MTSTETQGTGTVLAKNKPVTQNMIEQFLYREARYLDDREFEKWLQCYADDVVYWMPSWDDDDMLVEDPQRDISLIYYANKGGLQDRVFRIRTERSSATSLPEPRTSHNISNVEVIERRGDLVDVRFNWHTMYFRYKTIDPYYGTSFYTIDFSSDQPRSPPPADELAYAGPHLEQAAAFLRPARHDPLSRTAGYTRENAVNRQIFTALLPESPPGLPSARAGPPMASVLLFSQHQHPG